MDCNVRGGEGRDSERSRGNGEGERGGWEIPGVILRDRHRRYQGNRKTMTIWTKILCARMSLASTMTEHAVSLAGISTPTISVGFPFIFVPWIPIIWIRSSPQICAWRTAPEK